MGALLLGLGQSLGAGSAGGLMGGLGQLIGNSITGQGQGQGQVPQGINVTTQPQYTDPFKPVNNPSFMTDSYKQMMAMPNMPNMDYGKPPGSNFANGYIMNQG